MTFNPADTQGNIVRGYRHLQHAAYLFCEIGDPDRARPLLGAMVAPDAAPGAWMRVRSAEHWGPRDGVHEALNIAFTYPGLQRLGWGPWFEQFAAFREGMQARAAEYLLDTGSNRPEEWESSLRRDTHVLFVLYCDSESLRDEHLEALRERTAGAGMAETACQLASVLTDAAGRATKREHFGFSDGFSQPALSTGPGARRPPEGEGALLRPWALQRWRSIRLGEFLLGHLDEDAQYPGGLDAGAPGHNGTFMVWRKLAQNVTAFENYFDEQSYALAGASPDYLRAKAVGRWADGTSLARAPHAPAVRGEEFPDNSFDYSSDGRGARCPLGAHVRRAYPRSGLGWGTERSRRHRLIRRGLPYDEGDELGLIFVCFNASLTRQFELVQRNWLLDGDAFGLGADQDLLLGHGERRTGMTVEGDSHGAARFLPAPDQQFVRTRGGYYLFMPGIDALRRIAEGPARTRPVYEPAPVTVVTGLGFAIVLRLFRQWVRSLETSGGIVGALARLAARGHDRRL